MGTIFQKVAIRPVPATARITRDRHGHETAKWTPRTASKAITAPVRTLADGRKVIEVVTECYYARYRDSDGSLRTVSTGCRDEANARKTLTDLETRVERIKAGIMTRREVDAADRKNGPIKPHIDDYVERLPGKRGGPATELHRNNTKRDHCAWRRIAAGPASPT